jgi:hypothetical protein
MSGGSIRQRPVTVGRASDPRAHQRPPQRPAHRPRSSRRAAYALRQRQRSSGRPFASIRRAKPASKPRMAADRAPSRRVSPAPGEQAASAFALDPRAMRPTPRQRRPASRPRPSSRAALGLFDKLTVASSQRSSARPHALDHAPERRQSNVRARGLDYIGLLAFGYVKVARG